MAEKTKKPTVKKLPDAAEKGEVVHSPVVVRFVVSIILLEIFLLPATSGARSWKH